MKILSRIGFSWIIVFFFCHRTPTEINYESLLGEGLNQYCTNQVRSSENSLKDCMSWIRYVRPFEDTSKR
jgi:hypothetical protein